MRILSVLVLVFLFLSSPASACDLKNLLFGTSASHVIDHYNLKMLEIGLDEMPKKGEFTIKEFGNVACKNMPEGSFIEFTFIDDNLVKVKIENDGSSQKLLDIIKGTFGESDDKDRMKSPDGKTKVAMWDVGNKMSVLYMLGEDSRDGTIESADISSKNHHSLFQEVVEQKSKEIDNYLKENKLGKYSSSFSRVGTMSSGNTSGGSSSGGYDPKALEKLKNSYDKANEAWKERNQNNPRQGR